MSDRRGPFADSRLLKAESRRRPFWYLRRRPDKVASEIDEELRTHLDMRIGELTARGLSPEEARQEALRQFGDLEATRAYCRQQDLGKETHVQRGLLFEDLMQDLRICLRGLLRAPVLTLTIVATVGLGLGATTVIFAAVHAAFLRPLPYQDPARLVRLYTDAPPFKFPFSVADYLALREQQTHFDQVAMYSSRSMTYSNGAVAELLRGRLVSSNYFTTLGHRSGVRARLQRRRWASGQSPGRHRHAWVLAAATWRTTPMSLADRSAWTAPTTPCEACSLRRLVRSSAGRSSSSRSSSAPPPRKGPFLYTALARLKSESDRGPAADELRAINKRIFPIWKVSYQDDKATWSMMDLHAFVVGDTQDHCRACTRSGRAGLADRVHQRVQPADRTRHQPPA